MMREAFKVAAAACLVTMTSMAHAADEEGTGIEVNIEAADLDLSSAEGRELLDDRIASMVRQVCRRAFRSDGLGIHHVRHCRNVVLTAAHERRAAMMADPSSDDRYLGMRFTVRVR